MTKRLKQWLGFTLIELLIVVAIIAILAAIAVPNFLEAQMRAKVSRVKNDMRSLATAIESYTVDYTKHPGDPYDWDRWGVDYPPMDSWLYSMIILTSPISYMTSIPNDPFTEITYPGYSWSWYLTSTGYGFWSPSEPYGTRHGYDDGTGFFATGPRANSKWCLVSPGPDQFWEFDRNEGDTPWGAVGQDWPANQGDVLYYDSSNGTVSMGDIYYYGGAGLNPAPHPVRGTPPP